jgi:Metallo-beta-lactamase superfamily
LEYSYNRRGVAAEFRILFTGYVGERVAGTVSFVRDGEVRAVVDPGMVPEPAAILGPLAELVHSPDEITDVIFSHHHPDHTLNAALFPRARFHDFWAIYRGDVWERRPAEGFALSPSIRLMETPGHTPQDITTMVSTSVGTVAFTHSGGQRWGRRRTLWPRTRQPSIATAHACWRPRGSSSPAMGQRSSPQPRRPASPATNLLLLQSMMITLARAWVGYDWATNPVNQTSTSCPFRRSLKDPFVEAPTRPR